MSADYSFRCGLCGDVPVCQDVQLHHKEEDGEVKEIGVVANETKEAVQDEDSVEDLSIAHCCIIIRECMHVSVFVFVCLRCLCLHMRIIW